MIIRNSHIAQNVTLKCDHNGEMELSGVFIGHNASLVATKKIIIKNNTLIAENVVIRDQDHLREKNGILSHTAFNEKEILIDENCWIGAGAVVLMGTTMESNTIIGALSLIKNEHTKANTVWVGVPARMIKK